MNKITATQICHIKINYIKISRYDDNNLNQ
jgi:hypothetical protein